MIVKEFTAEDKEQVILLKHAVQEAIRASQEPFKAFQEHMDKVIRSYFDIPEGQNYNVQEFEISDDDRFVVKFGGQPKVL